MNKEKMIEIATRYRNACLEASVFAAEWREDLAVIRSCEAYLRSVESMSDDEAEEWAHKIEITGEEYQRLSLKHVDAQERYIGLQAKMQALWSEFNLAAAEYGSMIDEQRETNRLLRILVEGRDE